MCFRVSVFVSIIVFAKCLTGLLFEFFNLPINVGIVEELIIVGTCLATCLAEFCFSLIRYTVIHLIHFIT